MSSPFDDIIRDNDPTWTNFHESESATPRRHLILDNDLNPNSLESYRRTARAMQHLVGDALAHGDGVRAYGGAWSFSAAAVCEGILFDTRNLGHVFRFRQEHLHPACTRPAKGLLLAQAGCKIGFLHNFLADTLRPARSLPTCGASNGQTIAGALSTGTHGAALHTGAIPDYVVGIHLVTGPDRQVWLERASQPVIADHLPEAVFQAPLIRDDELFNAALVSFGSFGLIAGVLIETESPFVLRTFARPARLSELLPALEQVETPDVSKLALRADPKRLFHLEMRINPFRDDDAYLSTMFRYCRMPADVQPIPRPSAHSPGAEALNLLAAVARTGPLGARLAGGFASLAFTSTDDRWGALRDVFRDTNLPPKGSSCAMGVPVAFANRAIAVLLDCHRVSPAPVIFALRFVRSTAATLGFTFHAPVTCVLEVDGLDVPATRAFQQRVWSALRQLGVPMTWHWGKFHDLDSLDKVRTAYGDRVDRWLAARRTVLPTPALRDVFSNPMVRRAGLDE